MERAPAKLYFQAVAIERAIRESCVPEVEELAKSGEEKRIEKYYFAPLYSEVCVNSSGVPTREYPISGYLWVFHLVGPTQTGYTVTSATLQENS